MSGSGSSSQLMSDTSDSGDVDSTDLLACRELGEVEAMSWNKDCRPSSDDYPAAFLGVGL